MKKKILVIDDDENIRSLLSLELSESGYDVQMASDADSGLLILKKN